MVTLFLNSNLKNTIQSFKNYNRNNGRQQRTMRVEDRCRRLLLATACKISKQGARFPKQKPALDPPMNIGDVKRKRVIGGCFSKDTRFRLMERNISSGASVGIRSERSDTSTRPTSSKESYVLSRASARNPKRRMQNSRDILWPPEASPVFAPLRMIGVNARTP